MNLKDNKTFILSSKFFQLGNEPLTLRQLETYCKIWWPIQPEVTLGLLILLGSVAKEIRDHLALENFEVADEWKQVLRSQSLAIIDEMGLGRDPYGLMHHDLFIEQVCATTSLSREELLGNPIHTEANKGFVTNARDSFSRAHAGLCLMAVIETIAPELFTTQKNIFLAAGAPLEKLKHSNLHEQLEKYHAHESAELKIPVNKIMENQGFVEISTKHHSKIWKNFLDDVYDNVMAAA